MPHKSLDEVLVFTSLETEILETVRRIGAVCTSAELVEYLKNADLSLILRFSIKYPDVDSICKRSSLNKMWDEILQRSSFLSFECKPQPTIHSLDLLKGLLLYAGYKRRSVSEDSQDKQMSIKFLELSADLGCFVALNQVCQLELKKAEPNRILVFNSALRAASLYLTAGYLLLAACNYLLKLPREALECLILAEKLIPHSEVYTYNAYFGKPIDEIIKHSFGNLTKGKVALSKLADIPPPEVVGILYPAMEAQKLSILSALPIAVEGNVENDQTEKVENIPVQFRVI